MLCPICNNAASKFGRGGNGRQRFFCAECNKTFREPRPRPLDEMRVPNEKAALVLRMLLEGNSIRSVERLLDINRNTVMKLLVKIGERCDAFLRSAIAGVPCESVQCDEVWSYVFCKEKHRQKQGYGEEVGNCYTWTAIEKTTKLLLTYAVGKRDLSTGVEFARKLRRATSGHFQIDTDGLNLYTAALPMAFGYSQDHAQVIKIFGAPPEGEGRYSPAVITDLHVEVGSGNPDLDAASTSFIERSNKTLRMQLRRFTRLTDGHSKLWRNHEAAIALFFAYYNFCRAHSTIKTTPAAKAGLTDHVWSMSELIERVAGY